MHYKSIFNAVVIVPALVSMLGFVGCGEESIPNPDPPTGISATANSTSSVIVGWGSVSGASGYYIYRSQDAVGPYIQVGKSGTTSYTDNGLSAGTTYYYRVAAYNNAGTGSQSSYITTTTLPNAPTGVTATAASTSSITVTWSSVSGATSYYIYRSTSASGTYEQVGTSTTTSYTNTGLTAGTTYYYKVAARASYGSSGESAQSSDVSATTLTSAPTDVKAEAVSTSSITISWSSVSGATGYYIYRNTSSSGTYEQVGTSTTTSYTDTYLDGGTTYYYKMAAYNSGGESSQSSYASAITQLDAPTDVTATSELAGSGGGTSYFFIRITWSSVSGAAGYRIYRSASASGTYVQDGTSTRTSYLAADLLSRGETRYFTVAALNNSGGESARSSYTVVTAGN